MELGHGEGDNEFLIRTSHASLQLRLRLAHPGSLALASESDLVQECFVGREILSEERAKRHFLPGEGPQSISVRRFQIDFNRE